MEPWRNRIVGHGEEAPDQLLANPKNWRIQQAVLAGALNEVGWVQNVIVNRRTGHVVDGHLLVQLAISRDEPMVPVVYVDLDEREEAIILATIDPIAALADRDDSMFAQLVDGMEVGDSALAKMLANGAEEVEFPALPEGERGEYRTMTFTVTAEQEIEIKAALRRAQVGGFDDTGNENSNGNALARLAESYP